MVRTLGYTIEAGPRVIRPDVVEMHRMAKTDMSRKAVTVRLIRTSQLRQLCLQLRPPPKDRTSQRRQNQTGSAK